MADFKDQTVICIGSGPSLTEADCKYVARSGAPTIAINSSWKRARFAKIIFAGDEKWWNQNLAEIDINAEKWTSCVNAHAKYNLFFIRSKYWRWNSGLRAIELAQHLGAKKILLLGYDCSVANGKHWHSDHVHSSNPTFKVCLDWKRQFENLSRNVTVPVINCSRKTELTCFPLSSLEAEVC